jgi:predicted RNase H-like HicB family nuclease
MRYAVIIEKGPESYGAYVPDLPGCVAAADTREDIMALIQEAMELHVEGLKEAGLPIPEPSSAVEFVDVAA